MPKVSIIIPHFNIPHKLVNLLNTIPQREEIEVIVVDDVSTERLEEYEQVKKDYPWVTYLQNTPDNKGLGGARNCGMDICKGDWIFFADADDYFLDNLWETFEPYMDSDYDIVYLPPYAVYEGTQITSNRYVPFATLCLDYCNKEGDRRREELCLKKDFVVAWSKLYRRDFIEDNHFRFETVAISEDMMWSARTGTKAKKVTASYMMTYVVTDSNDSWTKHNDPKKTALQELQQRRYQQYWDEHMSFEDLTIYHRLGIKGRMEMRLRKLFLHSAK